MVLQAGSKIGVPAGLGVGKGPHLGARSEQALDSSLFRGRALILSWGSSLKTSGQPVYVPKPPPPSPVTWGGGTDTNFQRLR